MKLEDQKKFGISFLFLGAILFLAGLLHDHSQESSWLTAFGAVIFVIGLLRFLRATRLSRDPEKAADYDASLQDERTAYVANKARSLTFIICIYIQCIAVLAADLIFNQPLIGDALCLITCAQTLTYSCCFWYYNKKY